jgi:hypothetical protein
MERTPIEEIKARLDIVEVISSYLPLKRQAPITKLFVLFILKKLLLFLFHQPDKFGIVLDVQRVEIFLNS